MKRKKKNRKENERKRRTKRKKKIMFSKREKTKNSLIKILKQSLPRVIKNNSLIHTQGLKHMTKEWVET